MMVAMPAASLIALVMDGSPNSIGGASWVTMGLRERASPYVAVTVGGSDGAGDDRDGHSVPHDSGLRDLHRELAYSILGRLTFDRVTVNVRPRTSASLHQRTATIW